jgi:hypothetical protein
VGFGYFGQTHFLNIHALNEERLSSLKMAAVRFILKHESLTIQSKDQKC